MGKTLIAITNLPPRRMMGIDSCGMIISAVHHESGGGKAALPDGGRPYPSWRQALLSIRALG
ncbi:MAG: hypothetical protein V8R75_01740 [Oscillospiraceae bacterium]